MMRGSGTIPFLGIRWFLDVRLLNPREACRWSEVRSRQSYGLAEMVSSVIGTLLASTSSSVILSRQMGVETYQLFSACLD